ncbi:MAG: FAD-binding protein [Myxococcota bacterium]
MSRFDPIVLTDPETESWDDVTDVVVVGLGAAGASAAIEARDQGAEVVVLDRFDGGGATAMSGGVFYAGGGTHIQQAAGVEDTVDNMVRYLSMEVQDVVSEETLRRFCETSAENVRWLTDRGVPFYGNLCPVKTSYPTNEYHLYYSGNETFVPYCDAATPAPRGHRTDGGAFPGANLINPLRRTAMRQGVHFRSQARVGRLIVDPQERVVGAEYQEIQSRLWRFVHRQIHRLETTVAKAFPRAAARIRAAGDAIERNRSVPKRIRSRRGVILCAGGFIFNREMVANHAPDFVDGLPLGTAGDDGAGIALGRSVGGRVEHMDRVSAWRFLYPPNAFASGVLVDSRGERFANEFWYGSKIGEAMVEDRGGTATLILNERLKRLARDQSKPGRLQWFQRLVALVNLYFNCTRAKDVSALSKLLDVPEIKLRSTLTAYAEAGRGLREDPFHKDPALIEDLGDGPYYAIDCSLGSKRHVCAVMTLGGLKVDERTGQVERQDGATIEGLYAAGRSAVGVCSRQYVSGLSIADCVFSGRRAGRHAGASTSNGG